MLNNDIISDIASQLGHFEFAGQKNKGGVESNFEIEESLEIWFIDINDLNDSTKKVDSIIKPSGKWHLQVFNNGKPTHYARIAINKKSKKWYVTSFFESTLAGSINTGLEWISNNLKYEGDVKLLVVSSNSISSLLLEINGSKKILVANKPENSKLEMQKLYSFEDFRKIIIKEKSIEGVK